MTSPRGLPRIRACIFDMDGVLIDSEDLYTVAVNKILAAHGKPNLPWHIKAQLQGRPALEATRIFHTWAQLPLSTTEYTTLLHAHHTALFPTCRPLPGVEPLLTTLATGTAPPTRIALATSSYSGTFALKTTHLAHVFGNFPADCLVKGDDPRIPKGRGKPAPDIFLVALRSVNEGLEKGEEAIRPEECLVFEDSVPGVEAARRAGMQVVWVPHMGLWGEVKGREGEVLAGLTGEHVEEAEVVAETGSGGWPGKKGDAWGRRLETLEGFPFHEYGITIEERK
ncbi:HAD-like protein [Eremomyces bilateralis CBS 781.70]|uniref:HAD-like protein n=1 Tax=Eremomyces bilateralis CBS 781.70 TaxID=1392243 RepID=A0A6G1GHA5_9PEZI|nr:HAD-like protein [Eremomyces bilateralis CBS 781.70]KAF1817372.1 HAD-like protein [Eremomyces bilateralis CBS 781.70]